MEPGDGPRKGGIGALLELIPELREMLTRVKQVELEQVSLDIGDLELFIPLGAAGAPAPGCGAETAAPLPPRPRELIRETFVPVRTEYPARIREVVLGATKAEGGTRGKTVTIGGAAAPAYTGLEAPPPHPPVVAMDVFDYRVPLPKALKRHVEDVLDDPGEWAKRLVNRYGAEMVTVHLLSTDPLIQDTSPAAAAGTVETVLQAVDVPLIIGGCGDPKKDAAVFSEVAAMAEGERLLLNSVTHEMAEARTMEVVARAANAHGHRVIAFSPLELNSARELNRRLYDYLPPESIVMDLTTVALGYGLEYSFTIHERARHDALMGDPELSHPTASGCTNAWSAREAWMQLAPAFGTPEIRGPLWETVNALILLSAGVDLFMMMHPAAIRTVREMAGQLHHLTAPDAGRYGGWTTLQIQG
ncbi:MAG: acetyl-CoA decarbonylase/synthase delta subunit [Methanomicrobia archaeon]|nr:acetyl-CoA decarbonylase/synthase delta subunit [Methanomicrobia archaeon]